MAETISDEIERESVLDEFRKEISSSDIKSLRSKYANLQAQLDSIKRVVEEKYNEYQRELVKQREIELKMNAIKEEWGTRLE